MYTAINFIKNEDGVATSYSTIPYKSYLLDLKNKGFKPDLWGFKSVALAESTANSLVGTVLEQSLPPVLAALKENKISQPVAAEPTPSTDEPTADDDSGLEAETISD